MPLGKRKRIGASKAARAEFKKPRLYRTLVYKTSVLNTQQRVTLRYSSKFELTSGAGVASSRHFSANGLFDPDFAIGGHQPRGFDQLMAMYDHAVVLNSRIEVFVGSDVDGTKAEILDISLRDSTFVSSDYRDFEEYGVHKRLLLSDQYGGQESGYLTMSANPAKFFGRKDSLSDPELKNSVSANCKEDVWWTITMYGVGGFSSTTNQLIVTIIYDVVFIEFKIFFIS